MAVQTVYVELKDGPESVADQLYLVSSVLPSHMTARVHGNSVAVDVDLARDAVQKVLGASLLRADVYTPKVYESSANDIVDIHG